MYIDNLYTKLYSERDWNGLSQLVTEMRSFGKRLQTTKSNLTPTEAENLQKERDEYARLIKESPDWKNRNSVINRITGNSDKIRDKISGYAHDLNKGTIDNAIEDHNSDVKSELDKKKSFFKPNFIENIQLRNALRNSKGYLTKSGNKVDPDDDYYRKWLEYDDLFLGKYNPHQFHNEVNTAARPSNNVRIGGEYRSGTAVNPYIRRLYNVKSDWEKEMDVPVGSEDLMW